MPPTRLINDIYPQEIYIVAPVMYKDAQANLKKEFPAFVNWLYIGFDNRAIF